MARRRHLPQQETVVRLVLLAACFEQARDAVEIGLYLEELAHAAQW